MRFLLFGLRQPQALLYPAPLLYLFPRLPFSSIKRIRNLGMSLVDCGILQPSSIRLQPHMQRHGVPCGVLPVRDASGHLPVFLVLSSELPRWRPQDDRRWIVVASWHLFMLVARWLKWIFLLLDNLNDSRLWFLIIPDSHMRILQKYIFIPLLVSLRRQKGRLILLRDPHSQLSGRLFQI